VQSGGWGSTGSFYHIAVALVIVKQ
jgi:hypothetical protein